MAHLHWDGAAGAAGDMLLASLLDAGAPWEPVEAILRQAIPGDWIVEIARDTSGGLAGTRVTVRENADPGSGPPHGHPPGPENRRSHPHEDGSPAAHGHGAGHDHPHPHGHDHDGHEHGSDHAGSPSGGPGHAGGGRRLADMLAVADHPAIPPRARERASRVLRALAEAEGQVHGKPPGEVHFHEISGLDTLIDVLGACLALERLEVDTVSASPPFTGSGTVRCAHGVLPVPAPAVAALLARHGLPFRPGGGDGEMLTPTGAALLAALASAREPRGEGRPLAARRSGYGLGHRSWPDRANAVRATLGAWAGGDPPDWPVAGAPPPWAGCLSDPVIEWTAAVDDMTPEAVGHWVERTLAAGAVEASAAPATMKKGRPGLVLTALARPDRAPEVWTVLVREASSLGWRVRRTERWTLDRGEETVEVGGHPIRIKTARWGGGEARRKPEYEDCRAAALALDRPLEEVRREAAGANRALPR